MSSASTTPWQRLSLSRKTEDQPQLEVDVISILPDQVIARKLSDDVTPPPLTEFETPTVFQATSTAVQPIPLARFQRKAAILNELPLNISHRHVPVKKPRSYFARGFGNLPALPAQPTEKNESFVTNTLKAVASPNIRKKHPKHPVELNVVLQTKSMWKETRAISAAARDDAASQKEQNTMTNHIAQRTECEKTSDVPFPPVESINSPSISGTQTMLLLRPEQQQEGDYQDPEIQGDVSPSTTWLLDESQKYVLKLPEDYHVSVNHEEFLKMASFAEKPLTRYVPSLNPDSAASESTYFPQGTLRGRTSTAPGKLVTDTVTQENSKTERPDVGDVHVTDLANTASLKPPEIRFKIGPPERLHTSHKASSSTIIHSKSEEIGKHDKQDIQTFNHVLPKLNVHVPASAKPKPTTASRSTNPNGSQRRSILSLEQKCSKVLNKEVVKVSEDPLAPSLISLLHVGPNTLQLPEVHIEKSRPSTEILSLFQLKSLPSPKKLIDLYVLDRGMDIHPPDHHYSLTHAAKKCPRRGFELEPDPEILYQERHHGGKNAQQLSSLLHTRGFYSNPYHI